MDSSNETQHGFMSTDDMPFHFLRRETYLRLLDIWRRIHTHFMIYDRRNMEDELLRLITFLHFPSHTGQDIRILASAGFYYYGESDTIVCYCCGLWRRNWTPTDEPWAIHRRLSVRCLFIRNNREVNRPYYEITERRLRNLERAICLLQQTAVASGPFFVRSGSDIQAEIISEVQCREPHNNQALERIERHNIHVLPVANLQMRETYTGGLYMGVEIRNSHGFHIGIESRIISIASARRNIAYNVSHLGRRHNTSEPLHTHNTQSQPYTAPNENNSDILESRETSIQRDYGSERGDFDEEADRYTVQSTRLTFYSVQEQGDSISGNETVPKPVTGIPTTLANNTVSRRLSRSISEPLPYQYSCRNRGHIYTENTNCRDENLHCANESTDAYHSVTNGLCVSYDKHIVKQSGLHDDTENAFLLRASESDERDHNPVTVSYDNTSLEEHDLEETSLKRSHSIEEVADTQTKIDSGDFADEILEACHGGTSDTGSGTGNLISNITDTDMTLKKSIDDQYRLPTYTHTTGSKNVLDSSIQMQEYLSNDEEAASGATTTDLANPSLLATPEKELTDRNNMLNQKKNTTLCETHAEDNNHQNELRESVRAVQTESGVTGPLVSEQAVAAADSVANTTETTNNQNKNYESFQSTKSKITQISEIVIGEPTESSNQPATNVESPKVSNKCLEYATNVSRREELGQVDEVNDDTAVSSLFLVSQRQTSYRTRLLDTEESKTAEPDCTKSKETSMQKNTGMANISVLMNRHNGTSTPEFNLVHEQSITNIEQMQRMPCDFQRASSFDNANGSRINDPLPKSKADQEEQLGAVCQSKEIVDIILHDNESKDKLERRREQPPEKLPVLPTGPESSDISIRPKMKARQRHLSDGDSPRYIPLGPRCNPRKIQQIYPTVESRRRSFRNNSASPSEQLANAGFYSAGRDYTRCFSCGIGFQYSKLDKNIWIEHAKASPRCEYLLQRKGQDFIQAVVEGDDALVQIYLNIFTTECRRKPFNVGRAGVDMNETVSEEAFEGVVLTATANNSY